MKNGFGWTGPLVPACEFEAIAAVFLHCCTAHRILVTMRRAKSGKAASKGAAAAQQSSSTELPFVTVDSHAAPSFSAAASGGQASSTGYLHEQLTAAPQITMSSLPTAVTSQMQPQQQSGVDPKELEDLLHLHESCTAAFEKELSILQQKCSAQSSVIDAYKAEVSRLQAGYDALAPASFSSAVPGAMNLDPAGAIPSAAIRNSSMYTALEARCQAKEAEAAGLAEQLRRVQLTLKESQATVAALQQHGGAPLSLIRTLAFYELLSGVRVQEHIPVSMDSCEPTGTFKCAMVSSQGWTQGE